MIMSDIALGLDLLLGVEESAMHRVRRFGFGDGYEVISPDGINSLVREYNISTKPLSFSDFVTLKSDLDKVCRGDFFVATLEPYSSESVRYRIADSKYNVKHLPASDTYIFVFTLREAFAGEIIT